MIERTIKPRLVRLFQQYPFVTVTGPRQSGKTTLCRDAFPDLRYVNLEAPDQRAFAQEDPRGFLAEIEGGAIIDEVQRVPDLLSYLQVFADERRANGLFVLTGSQHFQLSDAIAQSLAGRTGLLRLLPFSMAEVVGMGAELRLNEILHAGFYPRIHDQGLSPQQALGDYFETYVERDLRTIGQVRNLGAFQSFVRICAGRVGSLLNLSALGADAGVSHATAKEWLSLLETSYIAFPLRPLHANLTKRLVKAPKLYFYDVGLAAYLIGVERADQIPTHPLRGALFENAVVVEALKHRFNLGERSNLSFFRDRRGLECDLLYGTDERMLAIEAKAGATISSDYFTAINRVADLLPNVAARALVYGGSERQKRTAAEVVPLADLDSLLTAFDGADAPR